MEVAHKYMSIVAILWPPLAGSALYLHSQRASVVALALKARRVRSVPGQAAAGHSSGRPVVEEVVMWLVLLAVDIVQDLQALAVLSG